MNTLHLELNENVYMKIEILAKAAKKTVREYLENFFGERVATPKGDK